MKGAWALAIGVALALWNVGWADAGQRGLRLGSLWGDDMVVQRGAAIRVWGWGWGQR